MKYCVETFLLWNMTCYLSEAFMRSSGVKRIGCSSIYRNEESGAYISFPMLGCV